MLRRTIALLLLALIATPFNESAACSWAVGYFHRVRTLKGHVIGANLHGWGPLGYVRLFRNSNRVGAKLTLYEYRWPIQDWSELVEVARLTTDKQGSFDFSAVRDGHYILHINVQKEWSDSFDVEITSKAPETKHITIDVSPVYPDCKGGHEFIVETKS